MLTPLTVLLIIVASCLCTTLATLAVVSRMSARRKPVAALADKIELEVWRRLRKPPFFRDESKETAEEAVARILRHRDIALADRDRLIKLWEYHEPGQAQPPYLKHRGRDTMRIVGAIREKVDAWTNWARSPLLREQQDLTRALASYVGLPQDTFYGSEGLLSRHHFIQEQADQCGYSTILYSLSPSSSIFTPNYVNGFRALKQQPDAQPDAGTTSQIVCCKLIERQSNGLSLTACPVRLPTQCPICHLPSVISCCKS